tara:strand:+ start:508 stop:960 length:453 start_codon:yes stop_codon:yes gene_type:complete
MISFFVYILKLLINLFVTTILVTDVNSNLENKNIKLMFFGSFFSLTLMSVASILSFDNSFYYGATIIVIYFVIYSLSYDFNQDEKIKIYLICLCAMLFGFGTLILTLIGFVASMVSYIILYNSTEFYKLFFSQEKNIDESSLMDEENEIK